MKLAELKRRLQPGVQLINTARSHKPELIGSIVTVKRNTPGGLQLLRRGETFYMEWPRPTRFKADEQSFAVFDDNARIIVAYKFLPPMISEVSAAHGFTIPGESPAADSR